MIAGVSTACLYPKELEYALYELALEGVENVEIFINADSELKKDYTLELKNLMNRFGVKCFSLHPWSSENEPNMFFTNYPRRLSDSLDYYKKYFAAMNVLGAKYFVFHSDKKHPTPNAEFYAERVGMLMDAAEQFGVKVAVENVARCDSGSLLFLRKVKNILGDRLNLMIDIKQTVRSHENAMDYVNALGSNIAGIHVSDHGELGDCLRVGKGRFNFPKFIKILKEKNPDAALIIELYRSSFQNVSDLHNDTLKLENMIKKA